MWKNSQNIHFPDILMNAKQCTLDQHRTAVLYRIIDQDQTRLVANLGKRKIFLEIGTQEFSRTLMTPPTPKMITICDW